MFLKLIVDLDSGGPGQPESAAESTWSDCSHPEAIRVEPTVCIRWKKIQLKSTEE